MKDKTGDAEFDISPYVKTLNMNLEGLHIISTIVQHIEMDCITQVKIKLEGINLTCPKNLYKHNFKGFYEICGKKMLFRVFKFFRFIYLSLFFLNKRGKDTTIHYFVNIISFNLKINLWHVYFFMKLMNR